MRFHQFLLLIGLVSLASTALAQTSANGSIRGYVRDPQGALLPGVAITATSPAVSMIFSAVSDKEGYYRLLEMPPGEYTLTAELQGFARLIRPGVVVRAGLNLGVHLEMALARQTETVTVDAETPMVESTTAVQSINISGDLQRSLPISPSRNWADSLFLVPGMASTEAGPGTASFYLHGSDFSSHVFQIDGADVASAQQSYNTYINLSTEAIADVQVKTAGIDASAPLGQGAVISLVTRSGSNRFSGALGVVLKPKRWSDTNNPGGTSTQFDLFQPDISLGGPILRDRWWFFGAHRYTRSHTAVSRSAVQLANLRALAPGFEPFDRVNDAQYSFFKTSAQISRRHQVFAFYQRDINPNDSIRPEQAGNFLQAVQGGTAVAANLSSVWSRLTTRLAASFNDKKGDFRLQRVDLPNRTVHQQAFLSGGRLTGTGAIAFLDNTSGGSGSRPEFDKLTLSADATYYTAGWLGSHELQAGLYAQPRLRRRTNTQYVAGGFAVQEEVLRDPSNPAAGTIPFHRQIFDVDRVATGSVDSRDIAFYLQDAWKPSPRLTVNAGVRVDRVTRKDLLFDMAIQRSTEIGPRFGVNYFVTPDQKNALRVSWGRIHETVAQNQQTAGTNIAGVRDLYDNNLDGTFETTFVTPASTLLSTNRLIDIDRHQPHVNELVMGYRRQFPGGVGLDVSGVRREYRDRIAMVEVNGIYDGGVFRGYRNEALNDVLQVTNNRWNWPVATSLEVQVTKQTQRVHVIGSYARQWRHIAGTWQPNDPASFIQPDAFPSNKGIGSPNAPGGNSLSGSDMTNAPGWRDHTLRVGVSYHAPWRLRLATTYFFQTGPWSGPLVTRIAAPDPRFGPTTIRLSNGRVVSNPLATTIRFAHATRSEGQLKAPATHNWSVRIGRDFPIDQRVSLEAGLEAFNLTNDDADQLFGFFNPTLVGSATFGQTQIRQLPRSLQLSLRLVF